MVVLPQTAASYKHRWCEKDENNGGRSTCAGDSGHGPGSGTARTTGWWFGPHRDHWCLRCGQHLDAFGAFPVSAGSRERQDRHHAPAALGAAGAAQPGDRRVALTQVVGPGVVKVKGRVRNEPGMDTFTFTARNRNTNEICQGTLTF